MVVKESDGQRSCHLLRGWYCRLTLEACTSLQATVECGNTCPYERVRLIGRGATADVYLVRDTVSGAEAVLKQLRPSAAANPELRSRFVLGARSAMRLLHPGVVRVLRVEEPALDPPYLIMEALWGESLADYLDRQGAMPQSLALKLAVDVAAGLAIAHEAGIVHGDVKPGNLYLVGPIGAPDSIKVIDFGLATDFRHPASPSEPSREIVLGTAQYMAPEQVLADPIDARADIYGFGVVLFRLLTGYLPFDLDVCAALFSHQLYSPAPPLSWLVDTIDPRLEQVVLRCMRKHPENRYASMKMVMSDLETILHSGQEGNEPISVLPLGQHPDVYYPKSKQGQEAARFLASPFRSHIDRTAPAPDDTSGTRRPAEGGASGGPAGASPPARSLEDWLCADLRAAACAESGLHGIR